MIRLTSSASSLLFISFIGFSRSNAEVTWPYGRYGLPKAKTGCPRSENMTWHDGWFEQTNSNDACGISPGSRLDVTCNIDYEILRRTFCNKTTRGVPGPVWPQGSYCIYKGSGEECPGGMVGGWIYWDEEDNDNGTSGDLPDDQNGENTLIEYCCQTEGQWYSAIELPVDRPFYLLPRNVSSFPKCQIVKRTRGWLEYITYYTEVKNDSLASDGEHVFIEKNGESSRKIYYCYYEGCHYQLVNKSSGLIEFNALTVEGRYHEYQYCSWVIVVRANHVVLLDFTYLRLSNCNESFLKIYDGVNDTGGILSTLCGSKSSSEVRILSSTNKVFMVLNSSNFKPNSTNYSEFKVNYSSRENSANSKRDHGTKSSSEDGQMLIMTLATAGAALALLGLVLLAAVCLCRRSARNRRKQGPNQENNHTVSEYELPVRCPLVSASEPVYETPGEYAQLDASQRTPADDGYQGLREQPHDNPGGYAQLSSEREDINSGYMSLNWTDGSKRPSKGSSATESRGENKASEELTIYENLS